VTSLSEAPSRILIVDNIPETLKHLSTLIGLHPELKVAGFDEGT